jgi:hypothetical protein
LCLLRAAKNSSRLRSSFGLFDIRNHNGHVKGLQRFGFEELILSHIDHKLRFMRSTTGISNVLPLRRVLPSAIARFAEEMMRSVKLSAFTAPICPSQHPAMRGENQNLARSAIFP